MLDLGRRASSRGRRTDDAGAGIRPPGSSRARISTALRIAAPWPAAMPRPIVPHCRVFAWAFFGARLETGDHVSRSPASAESGRVPWMPGGRIVHLSLDGTPGGAFTHGGSDAADTRVP